jgi:hypothetical protein
MATSFPTEPCPFIVYALPRSRTFWLSRFLTYGDWQCGHDEMRHARALDDVQAWLSQPCTGTVETGAAPFWRLVSHVKTIVIRRPISEVVASIRKLGFDVDPDLLTKSMARLDRKLDQIEHRIPDVLSVRYDDLQSEDTCKAVFERCLPYQHDHNWWRRMAKLNLQVNMHHVMRYFAAYQPQLTKLAAIARHRIMRDMNRAMAVDHDDGLEFREEKFMAMYADAKKLVEDHLVVVGESPDNYLHKNLALMQQLDDAGCLQTIVARCNGKVFGYMVTLLSPSLESPDTKAAIQTTFYGSPAFPGIGMRMQRASVEALRAKGIDEVYFSAGVRGSGQRNAVLFRRLGAELAGQNYKLRL